MLDFIMRCHIEYLQFKSIVTSSERCCFVGDQEHGLFHYSVCILLFCLRFYISKIVYLHGQAGSFNLKVGKQKYFGFDLED